MKSTENTGTATKTRKVRANSKTVKASPKNKRKVTATSKKVKASPSRKRRTEFASPLEAGRYFKSLQEEGMVPKEIALRCEKSLPAVYRYIQLAEMPKTVQKFVEKGDIPASSVLKVYDTLPAGSSGIKEVKEEISARKKRATALKGQIIKKMTMKRKIDILQVDLQSKAKKDNPTIVMLLEFGNIIKQGASVEEMKAFIEEAVTETAK